MKFRLPRHPIPRDLPDDMTGFKERAMRVRSAEVAFPIRLTEPPDPERMRRAVERLDRARAALKAQGARKEQAASKDQE
jgi:hypothetical protein